MIDKASPTWADRRSGAVLAPACMKHHILKIESQGIRNSVGEEHQNIKGAREIRLIESVVTERKRLRQACWCCHCS